MSAPERMVRWLGEHGYHPRSNKHGEALCDFLLQDLLDGCPAFRRLAAAGMIVWMGDFVVNPDSIARRWMGDLVVAAPAHAPLVRAGDGGIARGDPREIWMAIDAKSTMTKYGKARMNRARDLNSFQDIMHNNDGRTVVGGLMMLNIAERFKSPLRPSITIHRGIERLVAESVGILRDLPRAERGSGRRGLEAVGAIVVNHTNVQGDQSTLASAAPAPASDDPVSYRRFLQDLCEFFTERFGGRP